MYHLIYHWIPFFLSSLKKDLKIKSLELGGKVAWGGSSLIIYCLWLTSYERKPSCIQLYFHSSEFYVFWCLVFLERCQAELRWSGKTFFKKQTQHKSSFFFFFFPNWPWEARSFGALMGGFWVHSCANSWMNTLSNNGDGIKPDTLQLLQSPEDRPITGWRCAML